LSKAFLVLDDGAIFEGESWAARGETFGEAVFATAMTGYQETLTDPSYHKQVVVMTAPHIGNTGMNKSDEESRKIWVSGFVVRNPSPVVSNWRSWNPRRRYSSNNKASTRSRRNAGGNIF